MADKKIWTCPACGKQFPRLDGQDWMRCICGVKMDAAIIKDNKREEKKLKRIED